MWISSSGSFSNILRNDKSIEEQCAPGSQYAEMKENIAIMDSIFDDSRGLEEDLEVFRGVGDGFLSMLFQKIGLAPSEYAKKDGSLDYRKIDKEGQMQKLVGVVYTDQCYVSTTTNRGYAASWASDAEHYNAAVSEVMAAHNMTNISGSEYFVPGSAANEERIKIEGEINQKLETSKAGAHMMIMQVPAKTKGIFMDAMGSGKDVRDYRAAAAQNELTLDRGLLYKIDGVSGSAGNYQFQVSVIGQGPKKAGAKYDPKTETHERLKQPAMATGIQDV
jgi:hypothetical protein